MRFLFCGPLARGGLNSVFYLGYTSIRGLPPFLGNCQGPQSPQLGNPSASATAFPLPEPRPAPRVCHSPREGLGGFGEVFHCRTKPLKSFKPQTHELKRAEAPKANSKARAPAAESGSAQAALGSASRASASDCLSFFFLLQGGGGAGLRILRIFNFGKLSPGWMPIMKKKAAAYCWVPGSLLHCQRELLILAKQPGSVLSRFMPNSQSQLDLGKLRIPSSPRS